jgi:putative ABC transport system permease protein
MAAYVSGGGGVPGASPQLPPGGLLLVLVLALAVTLPAAIDPARRAGRFPPAEALRARAGPPPARIGFLVVVFAIVGLVGVVAWPAGAGSAGAARALSVYGLLLVTVLAIPVMVAPLGRLAGLPFRRFAGLEERLAQGSLATDRGRTALTVAALAIGLAMLVALGTVAGEARRAATAWLADVVPGDTIVTSIRPIGPDEPAEAALAGSPGVASVTPMASFAVASGGRRLDAVAIDGAALRDSGISFVAGDRDTALTELDRGGTVIVPRALADRLELEVGSTLRLAAGGGRALVLEVGGVVEHSFPGARGESILVGWPDALGPLGAAGVDAFIVRFEPDATAADRDALATAARLVALEPRSVEEVEGAVSGALGRIFGLFDALALVAILVAGLGIVNALAMGVRERVREIGVLRATGMTRGQVRRMVVVEAGILGLAGSIVGVVVGLAAGVVMIVSGGGRLDASFAIPWPSIGLAVVLGLAVAMLAAYWPARLASRIPIVRAVQVD